MFSLPAPVALAARLRHDRRLMAWRFWVDRGGTFTDVVARAGDGALHRAKLLSEDPGRYDDAVVEAMRRITGTQERPDLFAQAYAYNGLDDRVTMVTPTATRRFVYDEDGRVMGEYGVSATDVHAEFIWAAPQVGSAGPFGGGQGASGRNRIERADGSVEELGPCATVEMASGDIFAIETPGGGGFGREGD